MPEQPDNSKLPEASEPQKKLLEKLISERGYAGTGFGCSWSLAVDELLKSEDARKLFASVLKTKDRNGEEFRINPLVQIMEESPPWIIQKVIKKIVELQKDKDSNYVARLNAVLHSAELGNPLIPAIQKYPEMLKPLLDLGIPFIGIDTINAVLYTDAKISPIDRKKTFDLLKEAFLKLPEKQRLDILKDQSLMLPVGDRYYSEFLYDLGLEKAFKKEEIKERIFRNGNFGNQNINDPNPIDIGLNDDSSWIIPHIKRGNVDIEILDKFQDAVGHLYKPEFMTA